MLIYTPSSPLGRTSATSAAPPFPLATTIGDGPGSGFQPIPSTTPSENLTPVDVPDPSRKETWMFLSAWPDVDADSAAVEQNEVSALLRMEFSSPTRRHARAIFLVEEPNLAKSILMLWPCVTSLAKSKWIRRAVRPPITKRPINPSNRATTTSRTFPGTPPISYCLRLKP